MKNTLRIILAVCGEYYWLISKDRRWSRIFHTACAVLTIFMMNQKFHWLRWVDYLAQTFMRIAGLRDPEQFGWMLTVLFLSVYALPFFVISLRKLRLRPSTQGKTVLTTDQGKLWFLADLLANLLPAKEREQVELDYCLPEMIDKYNSILKGRCIVLARVVSAIGYCWMGWALRILEAWNKLGH